MAVKTKASATQRSKAPVKARTAPKKRATSTKSRKPSFLQSLLSGKRKWAVLGVFLVLFGAVGTYMLRPSSADTISGCGTYSTANQYTSYNCVKYLQRMINGTNYKNTGFLYYGAFLDVDGNYGPKTKSAVIGFQKTTANNTTPLVVDGITGPKTWGALCYRVKSLKSNTAFPRIGDAYNAGVSAGCQGTGWPTTTTTTSTTSYPPVARGIGNKITSCFGWRESTNSTHEGVDLAGGSATQAIYATHSGYVVARGYESSRGNYIVVRHNSPDPYDSWYQHLSAFSVSQGQKVSAGQKIGNMGNTGQSYGAHLHYTLSYKPTSGAPSKSRLASANTHMAYVKSQYFPIVGSNCGAWQ
jgi:murein DD-endopeptidase MepM/ murein hydrolase activator NlpD